jgi:hypothetical protein
MGLFTGWTPSKIVIALGVVFAPLAALATDGSVGDAALDSGTAQDSRVGDSTTDSVVDAAIAPVPNGQVLPLEKVKNTATKALESGKGSTLQSGAVTTPPATSSPPRGEVSTTGDDSSLLAMLGLAIALILALVLNIYLLRWRKILAEKGGEAQQIVVPEVFWDTFEKQHQELMAQRAEVENLRKAFNAFGVHQQELSKGQKAFIEGKIQELITNFIALQGPLSTAEAELKRYKAGYDHQIYKRFLERFIVKVAMELDTELADPNEDSLAGIHFVMMDVLDEFDIERFDPTIGDNYRTATGIADNPKQLAAPTADLEFTIVEILKSGYQLRSPDGPVILVPARVSVYGAFVADHGANEVVAIGVQEPDV